MDDSLHYLIMANQMLVQKALLYKLKDTGLTIGQPKILDYLSRHNGSNQKEIAKACFLEAGSLTTILNKMEEKGLIMRKQDPTDRRVWRVYPTQKMQELLPHVRLVMREWNEYLLEEFSEEEQEKLVVALEKLMQRAQTAAQESLKGR